MRLVVVATPADVAGRAAAVLLDASDRPRTRIGVATGSTPLGTYMEVTRQLGGRPLEGAQIYQLDEYVGLGLGHPEAYETYLRTQVADPFGVPEEDLHLIQPGKDLAATCRHYEEEVAAAGIDLQVLGIGVNGHIGFNEPGTSFRSATHVVALHPSTRRANAAGFGSVEAVPRRAVTQGIGTILRARRIMLLATGTAKAEAIRAALRGPITPAVPASALQLHDDVVVVIDAAAASQLEPSPAARSARR